MYTTQGSPRSAQAVAVATPCWPGARLGDDPLLAQSLGEQRLAERVVDLVGARVRQVLALQPDVVPELLGKSPRVRDRCRAPDEVASERRRARRGTRDRRGAPTRRRRAPRAPGSAPPARTGRRTFRSGHVRRGRRRRDSPRGSSSSSLPERPGARRRGRSARMSASPTSMADAPASSARFDVARGSRYRSPATATRSCGDPPGPASARVDVDLERLEIARVHPDDVASVASARSRSSSEWVSTSALHAEVARRGEHRPSSPSSRQAVISRTASAPAARASMSCDGWTGSPCAARAAPPPRGPRGGRRAIRRNARGSVRTEIAAAPAVS